MMIAIITGDIVNSRKVEASLWLPLLENILRQHSITPKKWEVYRGDSFQMEVAINRVFETVVYIKSAIKSIKDLDVRMGIGIGKKDYEGTSLKNSNGQAFVFSGETFDNLHKETLAIKTPWKDLDEQLNIHLELLSFIMKEWNANISSTIYQTLTNKTLSQAELAGKIDKKQAQISRELKKAGYEYIKKTINYCQKILENKCLSSF